MSTKNCSLISWQVMFFNHGKSTMENIYVPTINILERKLLANTMFFEGRLYTLLSFKFSTQLEARLYTLLSLKDMNIVEELVKIMSEENLKLKNRGGYTVLGYCAIVGNIQMAKCIIGKSRSLFSIGNGSEDLIPVVLALTYNPHGTEMARYLYSETPLEDLMPRNGFNGAMFITRAIYSKAIGKKFRFKYIFVFISML